MVEVGPRQVLTGLNRQILNGRNVALVGCDHPKRNGLQQLLHARACVEVSGALDAADDHSVIHVQESENAEITEQVDEAVPECTTVSHASGKTAILNVSGTSAEIGKSLGQQQSAGIRAVLRRYADLAGSKWDESADIEEAIDDGLHVFRIQRTRRTRGHGPRGGCHHIRADRAQPAVVLRFVRRRLALRRSPPTRIRPAKCFTPRTRISPGA